MKNHAHKIGAVFYALWGLLHILGGASILVAGSAQEQLAQLGNSVPAEDLRVSPNGLVYSVLSFHAFNLLWLGVFVLAVAVLMNWKNSWAGYWINLAVAGAADVGLLIFEILPGHLGFPEAYFGPVLWVLALTFSSIGISRACQLHAPRNVVAA